MNSSLKKLRDSQLMDNPWFGFFSCIVLGQTVFYSFGPDHLLKFSQIDFYSIGLYRLLPFFEPDHLLVLGWAVSQFLARLSL